MLILHAADLHLGKSLHERSLIPDQEHMLARLLETLRERRPAAILLAGDLYDRAIPQPEAMALFDRFLSSALEIDPSLVIVAISGNHDSAARLAFGSGILARAGVHLRTRAAEAVQPVMVERDGERLAVFALPFLAAGSVEGEPGPDASDADAEGAQAATLFRSQAELAEAAVGRLAGRLVPGAHNLLLAHCFARGGRASESERSFVGLAELVPASLFDAFDYAALGHLHRPQAAGLRGRYPGSPLAYSFSEAGEERGFLLVGFGKDGVPEGPRVEFVPLRPLHALRRVEGCFAQLAAGGAAGAAAPSDAASREDYVEVRLLDPEPVFDPVELLRAVFPNLLSVRQAAFESVAAGQPGAPAGAAAPAEAGAASSALRGEAGGEAAVAEDFAEFWREMRGEEADAETRELFSGILAQVGRAEARDASA